MDHDQPLLLVEQLSKSYGDSIALSQVSFDLKPNEILGLIGPNGAGKTTLLECITGLLPADSGKLSWHGGTIERILRRDLMFYLPDQTLPYAEQHTIHVLQFFAGVFEASPDQLRNAIAELELQAVLAKRVGNLSKGYQRRLLLAIALLANQPLLLLDEPFDGLDLRQTRQAMSLIKKLKDSGRSMLLSIHQLSDAEKICDRFVLLSSGSVLGSGSLSELRDKASLPDQSLEEVFLALT
ncbi:MAG: ABC transporter ATP-binding protein [Candidatus Obscuribacter sp.]|nr:ABC transporter ATP-binding protein [Candidatus Obscuribacter sp.]